jgi:predicted RNase H-like HicB family nuclease
MKTKKDLDYYLNLPWTYTLEREFFEGKLYYIIKVNELPGACTHAESLDECMEEIKEVIALSVEVYEAKGEPMPEPINKADYKGHILYRTDSHRHYLLAKTAKQMHKSISKTLDSLIDVGLQSFQRGL